MAQKRKTKSQMEAASKPPRSNDVREFVTTYQPCGPGERSLTEGPASDGGAPGKTMTEVWQRSVRGSWLEWILRKVSPEDAPLREKLASLRKKHLGPLVLAKAKRDAPISGRTKEQAKAAKADFESLERQAQRSFADAIRTEFPNPFK